MSITNHAFQPVSLSPPVCHPNDDAVYVLRAPKSLGIMRAAVQLVVLIKQCPEHDLHRVFQITVRMCAGREVQRDPLQSSDGWQKFTAGWVVGGLSGVAWGYVLTQVSILTSCTSQRTYIEAGIDTGLAASAT